MSTAASAELAASSAEMPVSPNTDANWRKGRLSICVYASDPQLPIGLA